MSNAAFGCIADPIAAAELVEAALSGVSLLLGGATSAPGNPLSLKRGQQVEVSAELGGKTDPARGGSPVYVKVR